MKYQVNFHIVEECPMCESSDITIREMHDVINQIDEYILICNQCGYKLKQDRPF